MKKIYYKFFGKLKYVISIISVDLRVEKFEYYSIKLMNEFIEIVNNEKYWMVHKIEKIRCFNFKTNKQIIHKPLFGTHEDITEIVDIDNTNYSFLKKHDSLNNIIRNNI